MRMNDNLQEIKTTLEKIRSDYYPELDSQIIEKIVDTQFANQEDDSRVSGRAETQALIKTFIDEKV